MELDGGALMVCGGEHSEAETGAHTRGVVRGFYRACRASCDTRRTRRGVRPARRGASGATGGRRGQGPAWRGRKRDTGRRKLQDTQGPSCRGHGASGRAVGGARALM
jgi:hypothetical protein